MPFNQAPLTILDASVRSGPRLTSTTPPRDGTGARGRLRSLACFQKTDAAVKDRAPRAARSRQGDDPASPRGKEQVPEGTKIRIAAARPSTPGHRRRLARRRRRPARKEQPLRCREPDLAPDGASFKAPLEPPRRGPPRGGHRS
jgi:hypothetical protein